jgi:hypothetical protein
MKNWKREYKKIFEEYEETDCGCYGLREEGHKKLKKLIQSLLTNFAREMIGEERIPSSVCDYISEVINNKRQELIKIAKKYGVKL